MDKENNRKAWLLDVMIIVFSTIGTIWEIWENGWGMLRYYTVDSNIFIGISCFLDIIWQRSNKERRERTVWIKNLKYIATCCMMLTFFVVVFILAPMGGVAGLIQILTEGGLLFHHTLCPVAAIISYYKVDCKQFKLKKYMTYIGMLPTVSYAIVVVILNIKRKMHGPYPFLYVYEQELWVSAMWILVILGLAYVIGWILWKGCYLVGKNGMKCYYFEK